MKKQANVRILWLGHVIIALIMWLLAPFPAWAAQQQEALAQGQRAPNQLSLDVPVAPRPVKGDGKFHLVYELYLKNEGRTAIDLKSVQVLGERADMPLAHYAGDELVSKLHSAPNTPPKLRLLAGQQAIVFIWLTVATENDIPASLRHRVGFTARSLFITNWVESRRSPVRHDLLPVLQRPLDGAGWFANQGPDNDSNHRRALFYLDGKLHISQRFAIDWVRLDQNGEVGSGDPLDNTSYYGYGAEVLSVADGIVTSIQDGIPENIPGPTRAVPMTIETLPGNYALVRLDSGHYALYAHLQPGSLRVRQGDRVGRGQVLGLLGNSGNSDGPHLHFQICDANSPLAAEGVPFVFESFEVTQDGLSWEPRQLEIPLKDAILRFPDSRLSWANHPWREWFNRGIELPK